MDACFIISNYYTSIIDLQFKGGDWVIDCDKMNLLILTKLQPK